MILQLLYVFVFVTYLDRAGAIGYQKYLTSVPMLISTVRLLTISRKLANDKSRKLPDIFYIAPNLPYTSLFILFNLFILMLVKIVKGKL